MKIFVAGHNGLVGSALLRRIESSTEHSWVGQTRQELDLLDRDAVFDYVISEKPDAVVIAAAKVGGIVANDTYPVDFLSQNLQIQTNLLDASHKADVPKLLFLGSSCIYPKFASQPIKEESLLTGPLEETNEAYAIAKIAGVRLVDAYRKQYGRQWLSAMPTNLYGPGDNFDPLASHVIPGLIRKFELALHSGADRIELWGTGEPLREFLHVDDLAEAALMLLTHPSDQNLVNIGSSEELSIRQLSRLIAKKIGFVGSIHWDASKPDGTPRKILDSSYMRAMGWRPKISLNEGLEQTIQWFREYAQLSAFSNPQS